MLGPIVLAILGFVVWRLWLHEPPFVRGFMSLLERPLPGKRTLWRLAAGKNHVGGHFAGREVVLSLFQKRGVHDLGYLVVAMRPNGRMRADLEDTGTLREWVARSPAREAWDDLELRYELKLSFAEGWLQGTWRPLGPFIFPGRFDEQRWRRVLRAMHEVVVALEPRTP